MEESDSLKSGEEIVISGLSGVFPNSGSVLEFGENLFNKINLISDKPRWISDDPEIPKTVGKISNINAFDAQFFKIGSSYARVMGPISKKILEHAYGAIFDSGNTHITIKGTRLGVYIGVSLTDFETLKLAEAKQGDLIVSGLSKSMIANRISYWFGGQGPSYCLDVGCASSTAALEKAYQDIKAGQCDAAIVGAGNVCCHETVSLNLRKMGMLCFDGKTKCFDKNGEGYVRAETISVLFLQKAKDAKRIYAQVYHVKEMYGKPDAQFLPFRRSEDIQQFLHDFYSEIDIKPNDIEYIEANGATIAEADKNELDAINKIFFGDGSVKIGCVKSNMGHTEAASGLVAVTKLCIAYHKGDIPENLHSTENSIINDQNVKMLSEFNKFNRGYTAINNFSSTGANYHVVLKGYYKDKNLEKYKCSIPRIVLSSGRSKPGVSKIFDWLKRKPIDEEEIGLLHGIFEKDVLGHTVRGYTILDKYKENATICLSESVSLYCGVRRPLWLVFSGVGSHWAGMGADLMRIPTFRRAIERCHKVLKPKGVDVIKIISGPDKTIFDNVLNAFVGVGAVQIGLTDILKEMGVEPDYIIGHSLGETVCAYCDGTLSVEETILLTYVQGRAATPLDEGCQALVGLGYNDIVKICPPEINVTCHTSVESSILSGPIDVMNIFLSDLRNRGVFVKEVPSGNTAYHSRYIANAGPALLSSLREVIKKPKLRSKKWISTSVPREHWGSENARYSSPEYHTNNLLGPVLYEEMACMIPENAVVVEIAPHGVLQAMLKRLHPQCTHISLTSRYCKDGVRFFLESIGKLYEAGYNPKVDILYPKVEFPVSTETPFLSHLVEWEHSETWHNVPQINLNTSGYLYSRELTISMHDDDYSYIADNLINGLTTIPEAALIVFVWETIALNRNVEFPNLSIQFTNVQFYSDVIVEPETNVKLSVTIKKTTNAFEIFYNKTVVASGFAVPLQSTNLREHENFPCDDFDDIRLTSRDVYQILAMRGFNYKNQMQSILSLNLNQNNAYIKWNKNWVLYLDSLLLLNIFMRNHNGTSKVKFVRSLKIDVTEHTTPKYYSIKGIDCFNAQLDTTLDLARSAGVEIEGIVFEDQMNIIKEPSVIRDTRFYPYLETEKVNMQSALEIMLQIVAENSNKTKINLVKLLANEPEIIKNLQHTVEKLPDLNMKIKSALNENTFDMLTNATNVLICGNVFGDSGILSSIESSITYEDFILALENHVPSNAEKFKSFSVLACLSDGKHILILLKKCNRIENVSYVPVTSLEINFSWISKVKNELAKTEKVVLVSENQSYSGALGFVQKLRKDGFNLSVLDSDLKFDSTNEFYIKQLDKNMTINVLKKGRWGGYYHTSCDKTVNLKNFALKNNSLGNIDSLTWIENSQCHNKTCLVQVSFSGLSVFDAQKSIDVFRENSCNTYFGMDFSGIDTDGDRIMGLISGGAMASSIQGDPDLIWSVPEHWSLEDAATVPLPYILAYYCLGIRYKPQSRQRVFITNGADAFGLALISLCIASDCTVFTTITTIKQKSFLLRLFPKLDEKHICWANEEDFCSKIMTQTQKKGCNLIVNTFTDTLYKSAQKCLESTGTFLDLSNHTMDEDRCFVSSIMDSSRSYIVVDLMNIFRQDNYQDKRLLQYYVSEGIASGIVIPLPRVVYSPTAVSTAFRLVSTEKSSGRVLLKLRDPVIMNQGLSVTPRLAFNPQDVVIVVCDESGLGIALTDQLIQRGARKVMLHLDTSKLSGFAQYMFISWSKREVSVELTSENIRTKRGCEALMKKAMKFGKVKAVFIVLDGNGDINVRDEFTNAYNEICTVPLNLDLATRKCYSLSYFTIVCREPETAGEEYAFSVLERTSELRRRVALPALVVQHCLPQFSKSSAKTNIMKSQTFFTFFRGMEIALKKNFQNVISFDIKENDILHLNKTILKILGVRDIEDLENETTLQDLNVNGIPLIELRAAIKSVHRVHYSLEEISRMTVRRLKELNHVKINKRTDFNSGIATFYKNIASEEDHLIREAVVIFPTRQTSTLRFKDTYLIMIPGFEGSCNIFNTEAEKLKMNAIGVNIGPDLESDTVRETAQNIKQLLQAQFEMKSKFYILGYSFGTNIALELAGLFEEDGLTGVVYCLDSSPQALVSHLNAYIGQLSESKLQDVILLHLYFLLTGNVYKYTKLIENAKSFKEKEEIIFKTLRKKVSYSEQYMRDLLQSAYKKICLARKYQPKMKLKSELVLLKGIAHPKAEDLAQDYNLSQYSEKPVKVFKINSDHGFAFADVRVSNIINGHILQNN